MEFRICFD